MSRCAAALLLSAGLLGFTAYPAAATKVVALVVGNESPDNGLSGAELADKLKALKDNLFRYGTESVIVDGMNMSRSQLLARVDRFEAKLATADLAIVYYAGLGARSPEGSSYLVPHAWNGRDKDELVSLQGVLERIRTAGVKGLVFLDAVKPRASTDWQVASIEPGLGNLKGESRPGSLQITLIDGAPGPTYAPGLLTSALLKQLELERISPPKLASLVQEEVGFGTSYMHVPSLFGTVDGPAELKRLSQDELATKQKQCVADLKKTDESTTTVADASGRPIGALGMEQPSRLGGPRHYLDWFCPDVMPRAKPVPRYVEPRGREDGPAKRARTREADAPRSASPTRASYQRASSGSGNGYGGGGGGSAARAAASGAPTP